MENAQNNGRNIAIFGKFKGLAKDSNIRRLDDDFLRRFLVGHQNDVHAALKAIRNYNSFIERKRDKWLKLDRNRVESILESQIVDVLDKTGIQEQKVVWIRLEKWDPDAFTADEILEVSGLLCELVYVITKEIKCIDVIMDMHNFSLKQLYGLSRKFAKRMIFFMSECLSMELLHIYVVRQPKIFYLGYALYKPFIEERMKKILHICGYDYGYLTENIGKDCLPWELDGTSKTLSPDRWQHILYQRKIQKDLNLSGYEFYEKSPSIS